MKSISDNWIIRNLENAIATWNDKLAELWQLITQTPESFKGGAIWSVIVNINSALIGIGYGLLVLFFAIGVFSSAAYLGRCKGRSSLCGISSALFWQRWPLAGVWS